MDCDKNRDTLKQWCGDGDLAWTYLYQLISGGGDPVALQNKVTASPRSAVALKDFCSRKIAGGTEK